MGTGQGLIESKIKRDEFHLIPQIHTMNPCNGFVIILQTFIFRLSSRVQN